MAFIDHAGVIVSYANRADEALAHAVAIRPWPPAPSCPFCHRAAHARACDELRTWLFASDPPPDVPPGQDEYPGIDYPEDE